MRHPLEVLAAEAAERAGAHFTRVVREGKPPEDIQEVVHPDETVYLPALLASQFGQSASHWRRVIDQQGVKVDGEAVSSYEMPRGDLERRVIQAGKRRFLRVRAP